LVILYGQFMIHGQRNIKLYIYDFFFKFAELLTNIVANPEGKMPFRDPDFD